MIMRWLVVVLLLVPGVADAGVSAPRKGCVAAATCSTPANGDMLSEGFLGTGYENTWTLTDGTATVDPDFTLLGTPPTGSCTEGMDVNAADGNTPEHVQSPTWTAIDPTTTNSDITFSLYVDSYTLPYDGRGLVILNANNSTGLSADTFRLGIFRVSGGLAIRVQGNSTINVAISEDTWYTVVVHLDTTAANSSITLNGGSATTFTRKDNAYSRVHLGAVDVGADIGDLGNSSSISFQVGAIWVNTP